MSGTLSPIFMQNDSLKSFLAHLYRKCPVGVAGGMMVLIALCSLPITAGAQRKKASGPRAVAVVTWNGDSTIPEPGTSVLTPVAILVEGRFYDAELYHQDYARFHRDDPYIVRIDAPKVEQLRDQFPDLYKK